MERVIVKGNEKKEIIIFMKKYICHRKIIREQVMDSSQLQSALCMQ